MLPDRVSNPGPLTYESGALPIARNYFVSKKKKKKNYKIASHCKYMYLCPLQILQKELGISEKEAIKFAPFCKK